DVGGKAFRKFRAIRKFDEEVFVVRRTGFEKLRSSMPGEIDFLFHAVADVENDPETYRRHFIRKITNLLLDLVLEQLEVFRFEIRDKPVCVVGDSHVHHDEIDIDFQRSLRQGYDPGREKHRTQNANLSSAGHRVGHTLSLYVHLFKWFVGCNRRLKPSSSLG